MTSYTTISNALVAVGAIPSSSLVTALRDNPAAIAEAATGAPIIAAGWHPVDKVTVGDGKDGIIYNSAVSGTVASVTTADFEDGYEYRMVGMNLRHSDTVTSRGFRLGYLKSGIWNETSTIGSVSSTNDCGFDVTIILPRIDAYQHMIQQLLHASSSIHSNFGFLVSPGGAPTKITNARFLFQSANIASGKIWLFRRREYASLA